VNRVARGYQRQLADWDNHRQNFSSNSGQRGGGPPLALEALLQQVQDGSTTATQAMNEIQHHSSMAKNSSPAGSSNSPSPDQILATFANLDHSRSSRTGFPEAVFAAGKTPFQIAQILDDMAKHAANDEKAYITSNSKRAILATRVDPDLYEKVAGYTMAHVHDMQYNEMARIITVTPKLQGEFIKDDDKKSSTKTASEGKRVIVACAGTTDMPVAEEAVITLQAAGVEVERMYDVGVAGLHRIVTALPRLTDARVGCIIVCAGMDGALPSVVGGLVSVPVIACPTSIGYGASFHGVSALLTMLNSCAPGVGVVNIDNGFGAAALAFKCIQK
jgi:NCAIR mutase (PurE)-related protein